jgi:hypothetical protein
MIQVERQKGTSSEDLYEIISAMIRNQKIADIGDNLKAKSGTKYHDDG